MWERLGLLTEGKACPNFSLGPRSWPHRAAQGLFAAGMDGRNVKAEPQPSIIYGTFLFLSDLS